MSLETFITSPQKPMKKILNTIKEAACAVVAVGCLALALVGLVISCLLGEPISLFTEEDK